MSGYSCAQNEDIYSDDKGVDNLLSLDDSDNGTDNDSMNWSNLYKADNTETGNPLAPEKKLK